MAIGDMGKMTGFGGGWNRQGFDTATNSGGSTGAPAGYSSAAATQQATQYQADRTASQQAAAAAAARQQEQADKLDTQQNQQQSAYRQSQDYTGQAAAAAARVAAPGQDVFSQRLQQMASGTFSPDDPSYQWRLQQGQQAVERSAAARGQLGSGNVLTALTDYAQGAASQEYGAQFSRMLQGSQNATQQYSQVYSTLSDMFNRQLQTAGVGSTLLGVGVQQGQLGIQQQGVLDSITGRGIQQGQLGVSQGQLGVAQGELAVHQGSLANQVDQTNINRDYLSQQIQSNNFSQNAAEARSRGIMAGVGAGESDGSWEPYGANNGLTASMGSDGWQTGTSWDGSGGSMSGYSPGGGDSGWASSQGGWGTGFGGDGVAGGISGGGGGD